jgi:uncharacterized protein DUF4154
VRWAYTLNLQYRLLTKLRAALGLLLLLLPAIHARPTQDNGPSEYELKAAFVFNFTKFVEWPGEAFASADAPFKICILGDDPFSNSLAGLSSGKSVNGRPIRLVHINKVAAASSCQVLFISSSEKKRVLAITRELENWPVLTVGDCPGFPQSGVMINLAVVDERIRLEVNLKASERVRVKISAKLLALARIVTSTNDRPGQ